MDELLVEYREIFGFPNYRVGDDGSVWSQAFGDWRKLKGGVDKDGYRKLILCRNGTRSYRRVSGLVLEAFSGPKPSTAHEVCHMNGVVYDDRAINLKWGTHKENIYHKKLHGTWQIGDSNPCSLLREVDIPVIRRRRKLGEKLASIALDYGVAPVTIQAAVVGRNWGHIPQEE